MWDLSAHVVLGFQALIPAPSLPGWRGTRPIRSLVEPRPCTFPVRSQQSCEIASRLQHWTARLYVCQGLTSSQAIVFSSATTCSRKLLHCLPCPSPVDHVDAVVNAYPAKHRIS